MADPIRAQLTNWAARLVRVVCAAELARDIDRDVAEPVRRIALEMRDAADLAALLRREPVVDMTNHHNALTCPHCNPKGLVLVDQALLRREGEEPEQAWVLTVRRISGREVVEGIASTNDDASAWVRRNEEPGEARTSMPYKILRSRVPAAYRVICDGCNVREPWEHRCHGSNAYVSGERVGKPCECRDCIPVASRPEEP